MLLIFGLQKLTMLTFILAYWLHIGHYRFLSFLQPRLNLLPLTWHSSRFPHLQLISLISLPYIYHPVSFARLFSVLPPSFPAFLTPDLPAFDLGCLNCLPLVRIVCLLDWLPAIWPLPAWLNKLNFYCYIVCLSVVLLGSLLPVSSETLVLYPKLWH